MRIINFHDIESLENLDCCFGLAVIYPIHLKSILEGEKKKVLDCPLVEKCAVTSQNPKWRFYLQENKENCEYEHLEQLVF